MAMTKGSLIIVLLLLVTTAAQASRFTDNEDGTITDRSIGVMWQQGEGGLKSWHDAVNYCDSLSLADYSDWRLPTVAELKSLVAKERGYPKIETKYFPDFPATRVSYWSSVEAHGDWRRAKALVFTFGTEDAPRKTKEYRVRCVRTMK
jgi:hypothetical protein